MTPEQHAEAVDALRTTSGEVLVTLADGWMLVSNSEDYLSGDYVRILRPDGTEYACWSHEEWAAEPQQIMGAIVNCLAGHRPLDGPDARQEVTVLLTVKDTPQMRRFLGSALRVGADKARAIKDGSPLSRQDPNTPRYDWHAVANTLGRAAEEIDPTVDEED